MGFRIDIAKLGSVAGLKAEWIRAAQSENYVAEHARRLALLALVGVGQGHQGAINAVASYRSIVHLGATLDEVREAIAFFTGALPTRREMAKGVRFQCPGYGALR